MIIFKFIYCAWRIVEGVGRVALGLAVLIVFGIVMNLILLRSVSGVPDGAALLVRPVGNLVDAKEFDLSLTAFGVDQQNTELAGLIKAIGAAATDKRIKMLVVETNDLQGGGLAQFAELRDAIVKFKKSGKPVLARAQHFGQGDYYLASAADEVHLAADGSVDLHGLSSFTTYYREAFDTLGVKVNVFRAGQYKAYGEPYTRTDMSEEARAATTGLITGLWGRMRADITASRKITPEAFNDYVLKFTDALRAAQGDSAKAALDAHLVDHFTTHEAWHKLLRERLGDRGKIDFKHVDVDTYLAALETRTPKGAGQIALIVGQGTIVDGNSLTGAVNAEPFAQQLRQARQDANVKAVVVRLDSSGGSVTASELIRQELELLKDAGKPVVVSMGATSASGAYWIASAADEIVAHPLTLTGSIGVFSLLPDFSEPYKKLGLHYDGVTVAPTAPEYVPFKPLDENSAEVIRLSVENSYQRFLQLLIKARRIKPEDVDRIAQGRVWSGESALKLGLVDTLGGLDVAIASAARRAKLSQYEVSRAEPAKSNVKRVLQLLNAEQAPAPKAPTPVGRLVAAFNHELQSLAIWNDPAALYSNCLCRISLR